MVGWLANWLVGWLVGWVLRLVDCSVAHSVWLVALVMPRGVLFDRVACCVFGSECGGAAHGPSVGRVVVELAGVWL